MNREDNVKTKEQMYTALYRICIVKKLNIHRIILKVYEILALIGMVSIARTPARAVIPAKAVILSKAGTL